jgi:hypothetical protein
MYGYWVDALPDTRFCGDCTRQIEGLASTLQAAQQPVPNLADVVNQLVQRGQQLVEQERHTNGL